MEVHTEMTESYKYYLRDNGYKTGNVRQYLTACAATKFVVYVFNRNNTNVRLYIIDKNN